MSVKTSSYRMEEELRVRLRSHLLQKNMEISEWITMKALEELGAKHSGGFAKVIPIGEDPPAFVSSRLVYVPKELRENIRTSFELMHIDKSNSGWVKRSFGYLKVQENCATSRD